MFFFYQLILSLLIIISPILILFRILKNKDSKLSIKEKFCIFSKPRVIGKLIWFHGASVGEILSIIPLLKYYENKKDIKQILVTSSTLSSSIVLKKFKFKKTVHQFYPIDHMYFINKFINYWKPCTAIFIDSEIWPCMYKNLNKKNIPLILLNARLTNKSFNRWKKIRKFSKSIFDNITIAYPQNLETQSYLKKISSIKIKLIGNLKFADYEENITNKIKNSSIIELKKKNIWVASSTHNHEEIFCAKAHIELKKRVKNLTTIIIPRHIERVGEIIQEITELNLKVARHSENKKNLRDIDIYLVDTFGETKKFHKISPCVFIGGSIVKKGGQNPLEAARYGAKILYGPSYENFKDVYKLLNTLKVSKIVNSPSQLSSVIIFKKNKYIGNKIRNIGKNILEQTIKELDDLINDQYKKT